MEKSLEKKLEWFGYEKQNYNLNLGKTYDALYKLLSGINLKNLEPLEIIDYEEMKQKTVEFYEKYFDIHDVFFVPEETFTSFFGNVKKDNVYKEKVNSVQSFIDYYKLCQEVSPFNLTVKLNEGDSMDGKLQTATLISNEGLELSGIKKIIPFRHIELGKNLTNLSICTYIHEISHSQTESIPGYAKSYFNKEVISIFLEKVSAYELDPTGNLLKHSEKRRFMDISKHIMALKFNENKNLLSESDILEAIMYIRSSLIAEKLFDMYLNERKDKHRRKYIDDIQDVFDAKITVEDFIDKRKVTIEQGKNLELIKRHM